MFTSTVFKGAQQNGLLHKNEPFMKILHIISIQLTFFFYQVKRKCSLYCLSSMSPVWQGVGKVQSVLVVFPVIWCKRHLFLLSLKSLCDFFFLFYCLSRFLSVFFMKDISIDLTLCKMSLVSHRLIHQSEQLVFGEGQQTSYRVDMETFFTL